LNILASIKKTSAVFLAIVLITGTIAAISPSFITGANAQAQSYYDGMDSRPNNYGPSQYTDRDNSYNSYESDHYGMDNNDKKSYGNDNSYDKPQYQPSYKSDYKQKYSSYGEKYDKSNKDNSKSVTINKINCINTNININGNNTGDINLGNKGQGYVGIPQSDAEGYYDNGYNTNYKNSECNINNNNNNTNIVIVSEGGNTTNGNQTLQCEDCFTENLNSTQLADLVEILSSTELENLAGLCDFLSNSTISNEGRIMTINGVLLNIGVPIDTINIILQCLDRLGIIDLPTNSGL
jgi:hypothetical protein